MAQKKVIGEIVQTVSLDNINDITYKKGVALGVIMIDSIKETFNIALENTNTNKLYSLIHDLVFKLKNTGISQSTCDYGQLASIVNRDATPLIPTDSL